MWLRLRSPETEKRECSASQGMVATIGSFDGLHAGHRQLVSTVVERAASMRLSSGLITFSPHPAAVLKGSKPARLSKIRQLAVWSRELGLENLIILHFTLRFAQMEAAEFVEKILFASCSVRHLVIGPDASVGRKREGSAQWICRYFSDSGRSAEIISPYMLGSERISSSMIRSAVLNADLESAARLLGRPFTISSRVVRGDGRGRILGFPTANLLLSDYVKPPYGVYFCRAELAGKSYYALANFGIRPTFASGAEVFECYLMDYSGEEFYGQRIELQLIRKIRNEIRFESAVKLKEQIVKDLEVARNIIENY